ncbi:histidine kinase [Pseudofrankia sp. BMG5.37]|uniref:sensor histidine kinase n=1 Tax=Pseudofrankia sp. BMG5.37 TaxID=3050035 RepID=UPI002894F055|nr:histidine kinase [Pseudofrankia sp. BMG5.37]MDT3440139.1 histidine kinase [Pseudofrankia sp. BMG5.37]
MTRDAPARWLRRHPDALLTTATLPIMLVSSVPDGHWRLLFGWPLVLVVLAWLPLTVRTLWPLLVAAVVVTVDTVDIAVAGHDHPATATVPVATILALYTISLRYSARVAWSVAAITGGIQFTVAVFSFPHSSTNLLYFNWPLVATVVGRLVQERRERIAAAEQRAEAAERSKKTEARRQVTAERIRVAHELHDVLAHHIAVVNAQAGVAQYLLRTDPDAANQALTGIAVNSRAALDELRATLGVLRAERSDSENDDARAPAPGADQLGTLLNGFREAGMLLTARSRGTPQPLSGPADLALYRIAQEALTNAIKHAPGSAVHLDLKWSDTAVILTVDNAPPSTTPPPDASELVNEGTGHGLLGMRERTAAAGGSVSAGFTTDGGYQVTAKLPVLVTHAAPTSGRPGDRASRSDATSTLSPR